MDQEAGQLIQTPLPGLPFRILVTGWRDWPRAAAWKVWEQLELAVKELAADASLIIVTEGESPYGGVDDYAYEWAALNRPRTMPDRHPANWARHGKAAGPLRNAEMVALGPDVCLAFPGPMSKGTVDCMKKAEKAQVLVRTVEWDPAFLETVDDTPMSPVPW